MTWYKMNDPKVYIIILNWNGYLDTLECLDSVTKITYSNYKILLIDNASSDDSVSIIRNSFPDVEMILNKENLGFTGGNNLGIKYALDNGSDYVWLLNNDSVVDSDVLDKLILEASLSNNIGMVSPVIRYYGDQNKIQFCASYVSFLDFTFHETTDLSIYSEWNSDKLKKLCLWGTALLISANLIKHIGMLDDRFFAYYEDTDYSIRSIKAGFINKIACDVSILHKTALPGSFAATRSSNYYYYMTRNYLFFLFKNTKCYIALKLARYAIAQTITKYDYYNNLKPEIADSFIDGLYNAIINNGGSYIARANAPVLFKKLVLSRPSRYFCNVKLSVRCF